MVGGETYAGKQLQVRLMNLSQMSSVNSVDRHCSQMSLCILS